MRLTLLAPITLAPLFVLTGCYVDGFGVFDQRFGKDFHYTAALKSSGRLSLESFNGSVEISGWDQETVDISGTKFGPGAEAAESLKIEISNSPDSVSIRAVRPSALHGNWGAKFFLKAPRRAVLDLIRTSNGSIRVTEGSGPSRLRTSNGSIRIQGFEGELDAQTSNGPVELVDVTGDVVSRTSNGPVHVENLRGSLQATSSNGGITVSMASSSDRTLRLETSNGGVDVTLPAKFTSDVRINTSNSGITLHLPPDMNGRVLARTNNASVSSDFQVRMQGEFSKGRMDGVIGNGGPLLDLTTSNGGIRLLKQ